MTTTTEAIPQPEPHPLVRNLPDLQNLACDKKWLTQPQRERSHNVADVFA